jgi:hypothetical protein
MKSQSNCIDRVRDSIPNYDKRSIDKQCSAIWETHPSHAGSMVSYLSLSTFPLCSKKEPINSISQ